MDPVGCGRRHAGARRRFGRRGRKDQDRHRGRLSALQHHHAGRQGGRLRHRHRQCALRADEGRMRDRHPGLGWHHSGPAGQEIRRHHRLDEHHRGTQEAGRLHPQILHHAACAGRPEGRRYRLDRAGLACRQDGRCPGLDHPGQLRPGRLRQGRRRGEALPDPGRGGHRSAQRPARRRHLGQVRAGRLDEEGERRLLQAGGRRQGHRDRGRHRRAPGGHRPARPPRPSTPLLPTAPTRRSNRSISISIFIEVEAANLPPRGGDHANLTAPSPPPSLASRSRAGCAAAGRNPWPRSRTCRLPRS